MTTAPSLFDFDGATYSPKLDRGRLNRQLAAVANLMRDGAWRTLAEIEAETGEPQASISARLRDLKKSRFGSHIVEKRRLPGAENRGVWQYRVVMNTEAA